MSTLVIPDHLKAQFEEYLKQQTHPLTNPVFIDRTQQAGTTDANGNFIPAGSQEKKYWNTFRDNFAGEIINRYVELKVPVETLMGIFQRLLKQHNSIISQNFINQFSNESEQAYQKMKSDIERRKEIEKELQKQQEGETEEKAKGITNQNSGGSSAGKASGDIPKIIKLSCGVIFNISDFENVSNGKLKLKSSKKAIKLNEKQLEELTAQL